MSKGNRNTVTGTTAVKSTTTASTVRANRATAPATNGVPAPDQSERRDIPTEGSANFDAKVRETLSTYLGKRGDPLDRGVTVRDLTEAGLVAVNDGYSSNRTGFVPISGVGTKVQPAYVVDLTPPPSPTGFVASAAVSTITVQCDGPAYSVGNGHSRSHLYGATYAGGTLPTFASASRLTSFAGNVFSYPTNPATTWRLWLTWETKDGVESTTPAGGLNGVEVTTSQDPSKLVAALAGQISTSALSNALNSRIDLIDGGAASTVLPYPLVDIAAAQTALNQRITQQLTTVGSDLLLNAATINTTAGLVTAAGIYVDPGTGTVKISGLEATNTTLSTVDARLSAAESSIVLKASKTYVDSAIATAVLTPSQVPIFGALDARLTTAEANISGLTASVGLKATIIDLTATNARMTTAETNISALQGTITSKVDTSTFTLVTGGLDVRLGSAETTIAALGDTSSITNLAIQSGKQNTSMLPMQRRCCATS